MKRFPKPCNLPAYHFWTTFSLVLGLLAAGCNKPTASADPDGQTPASTAMAGKEDPEKQPEKQPAARRPSRKRPR